MLTTTHLIKILINKVFSLSKKEKRAFIKERIAIIDPHGKSSGYDIRTTFAHIQ